MHVTFLIGVSDHAETVLLAAVPPAPVLAAISPEVVAVARLFVILELTFVSVTVFVDVNAKTVHVILPPLATVLTAILPRVLPDAVDRIVEPGARVAGAIDPGECTGAVFQA